ncbi:hypothetical protein HOG21_02765 [bacterium]|nr:hypothetical protein [bacterium]
MYINNSSSFFAIHTTCILFSPLIRGLPDKAGGFQLLIISTTLLNCPFHQSIIIKSGIF